jgi:hypothetical protein
VKWPLSAQCRHSPTSTITSPTTQHIDSRLCYPSSDSRHEIRRDGTTEACRELSRKLESSNRPKAPRARSHSGGGGGRRAEQNLPGPVSLGVVEVIEGRNHIRPGAPSPAAPFRRRRDASSPPIEGSGPRDPTVIDGQHDLVASAVTSLHPST